MQDLPEKRLRHKREKGCLREDVAGTWSEGLERQREPRDEEMVTLCAVPRCPPLHQGPQLQLLHSATLSPCSLPLSSHQLFSVSGILSELWREDVGRKGGD